ncbi:MAG: M20/M25/M40 family metallo-hydrolase [Deltaproteobacteria bacterium]|nr:M20/M25/M40 family metallo-hydrolase [Deltaproteobacteria bacterium]
MKQRIREHFAAHRARYREELLALLTDMVAEPTVNAGRAALADTPALTVPGEETRIVDLVRPVVEALGAHTEVHALHPLRANLLATLGTEGPILAVGVHADIVPPGDGWDSDPYVVTVRDGKAYGRGTLDDKGPIASSVAAMRLLTEVGVPLAGRFQLAVIASEEFREAGEPDPGIGFLLERGLLKPDFAIIPDIGEHMDRIDVAEKGRLQVHVRALGRQAHGSTPERGVNAVNQLARFLVALEGHTLAHTPHEVLGGPSVNVGIFRGGAAANIVPGEAEAVIDIRYVPGQGAAAILAELRALAAQVGGSWELRLGDVSVPHAIDADNPLVHAIRANSVVVRGVDPQPFGMGGGTFAKSFNLGGIPAVGWGPGDDEDFHVANESVPVEELVDFAELLALVAVDLLGLREG